MQIFSARSYFDPKMSLWSETKIPRKQTTHCKNIKIVATSSYFDSKITIFFKNHLVYFVNKQTIVKIFQFSQLRILTKKSHPEIRQNVFETSCMPRKQTTHCKNIEIVSTSSYFDSKESQHLILKYDNTFFKAACILHKQRNKTFLNHSVYPETKEPV